MQHITSPEGRAALAALEGQLYKLTMTIPYRWEGVWPVVTIDGLLTGELAGVDDDGACKGYILRYWD